MSRKFSGIWATFPYLDDMCEAIQEIRESGFEKITTHAPCPRHEIDHALGNPQSRIPYFTLAGALVGLVLAAIIMIKMTLAWILPVSGKSVLSIPIMVPIAFEMAVLISIYFTIGGLLLLIYLDTRKHHRPQSKKYKSYNRFMRDRFGVVVPCQSGDFETVQNIMKKHQAEEVNLEN